MTPESLETRAATGDPEAFGRLMQSTKDDIYRFVRRYVGDAEEAYDLIQDAYAAAWLLRKEHNRTGNIWQAIGAYHSRTPHRRDAYIAQVKSHLARLSRSGIFALPPLAPDSASDITPGRENE